MWRVVQAFGASSGHSVGMGVIGDIYRLEERGTASGIYFGVRHGAFIGPDAPTDADFRVGNRQ